LKILKKTGIFSSKAAHFLFLKPGDSVPSARGCAKQIFPPGNPSAPPFIRHQKNARRKAQPLSSEAFHIPFSFKDAASVLHSL